MDYHADKCITAGNLSRIEQLIKACPPHLELVF
jgi:hypothetical protein